MASARLQARTATIHEYFLQRTLYRNPAAPGTLVELNNMKNLICMTPSLASSAISSLYFVTISPSSNWENAQREWKVQHKPQFYVTELFVLWYPPKNALVKLPYLEISKSVCVPWHRKCSFFIWICFEVTQNCVEWLFTYVIRLRIPCPL